MKAKAKKKAKAEREGVGQHIFCLTEQVADRLREALRTVEYLSDIGFALDEAAKRVPRRRGGS